MTQGPDNSVAGLPGESVAGVPGGILAALRPQAFGRSNPYKILDPLVEPLWVGLRGLALIDRGTARLLDATGQEVDGMDGIVTGLAEAALADTLVLDGWVTKQTSAVEQPTVWPDEMPSMGRLLGLRRNRAVDTLALKEEALAAHTFSEEDPISYVAVDLLWLDDTSLLDVPLLERRRLLDTVIRESDAVRVGPFIRPPVERWVRSWRGQGFTGLTYKAANSRYLPGQPNPDWALAGMPRR